MAALMAVGGCSPTEPVVGASSASGTSVGAGGPHSAPLPSVVRADPVLNRQLVEAAARNDVTEVRALIARGADLESRDDLGRTPVVAATKNRAVAAARVLIAAGADVNAKDDLQDSAYLYAGAEGFDEILAMTLRHGADLRSLNRFGGTPLIPASENGHVSTVRLLLTTDIDVNHVNVPGWTALHEAIVYGDGTARYEETVTALLDAGADPLIRDASGRTALENAENRGQLSVAAILRGRQD